MTQHDPTAAATSSDVQLDETSLEDVALLERLAAWAPEASEAFDGGAPAEATAVGVPALAPLPQAPPFPFPLRTVSGRYRSPAAGFQLELRVDVDRVRPMRRVSGDFLQISGGTTSYFGSFIVDAPAITVSATQVVLRGLGRFTFGAGAPIVQVTIPRRIVFMPPAPATVQFFTTANQPGATYLCGFESPYFRSVRIETDCVSDVVTPVFNSYATGSLPSGGPARTLGVVSAYAEAGIQMIPTSGSDIINIGEAVNGIWSNAELHASMVRHFTLWRDVPQWAVWQLVARLHDLGPGLYGIMFDQSGSQRQGCAVFHEGIGGTTADKLRLQLYTYVHELGHCFNLLHSWQKSLGTPPQADRPNALSWMNYPWNYPLGGAPAFWSAFPFQFDDPEVVHLRHGFYNNVVMGGSAFAVGSALMSEAFRDPMRDESGLELSISTHKASFQLGEPVVLQLALTTSRTDGKRVHNWLHPNFGLVSVAIRTPARDVRVYEPYIDHLVGERTVELLPGSKVEDSAYIGYGRSGFYFDHPGIYEVRAAYAALDGSTVLSNVHTVRVQYPASALDNELAELFIGDEQGVLLYLLGSDAPELTAGNAVFEDVIERYGEHEMAQYARLVKGINAAREFKTVVTEPTLRCIVRPADQQESVSLLSPVVASQVLDPVSADMVSAVAGLAQAPEAGSTRPRKSTARRTGRSRGTK